MSRVYFHSQDGTAELRGAERAHCNVTCSRLALQLLALREWGDDPILQLVRGQSRRPGGLQVEFSDLKAQFSIGEAEFELPDGRRTDAFTTSLNTMIDIGNDVLILMARLHGQCELHGYVEGKNRVWLADIIEDGLGRRLLRANMGWGDVRDLLRARDDRPVVTSYSVCDGFPNKYRSCKHCGEPANDHVKNERIGGGDLWLICGMQATDEMLKMTRFEEWGDDDGWYELPKDEQWRRALDVLRADHPSLEWKPDTWRTQGFGDGVTAMEIRAVADALVHAS